MKKDLSNADEGEYILAKLIFYHVFHILVYVKEFELSDTLKNLWRFIIEELHIQYNEHT